MVTLRQKKLRLTMEIMVRVVADAAMVVTAEFLGLILRFLWLIEVEDSVTVNRALLGEYLKAHVTGSLWLLSICLSSFALSSFYPRRPTYLGRYKSLVIAQGVTTSYLIFAC